MDSILDSCWSGEALTLNSTLCSHGGEIMGVAPALQGVKP